MPEHSSHLNRSAGSQESFVGLLPENPQSIDELMVRHGATAYQLRNGVITLNIPGKALQFHWQSEYPAGYVAIDDARHEAQVRVRVDALLAAFAKAHGSKPSATKGTADGEWVFYIDEMRPCERILERDFIRLLARLSKIIANASPTANA